MPCAVVLSSRQRTSQMPCHRQAMGCTKQTAQSVAAATAVRAAAANSAAAAVTAAAGHTAAAAAITAASTAAAITAASTAAAITAASTAAAVRAAAAITGAYAEVLGLRSQHKRHARGPPQAKSKRVLRAVTKKKRTALPAYKQIWSLFLPRSNPNSVELMTK